MSQRLQFVTAASCPDANIAQLCRDFSISRDTAYRLLARFKQFGPDGLCDQSRKPTRSPDRTAQGIEQRILLLRDQHPAWGPRKLRARLLALGLCDLPAPSTVGAILKRHDRIDPIASQQHTPWRRFEAAAPNDLVQFDFKGWFKLTNGVRCEPLTIIDDHSRFALGVFACPDQKTLTVRDRLSAVFRRFGLPAAMLMDNGSCWGGHSNAPYTELTVWLMRLGIRVKHGRPCHPQTQGKDERFNRTLKDEALRQIPRNLRDAQRRFNAWLEVYNKERPHEALGLAVPSSRYTPSPRVFPARLPQLDYGPTAIVRKVQATGTFSFNKRSVFVGTAFHGQSVALKPTELDGAWDIAFASFTLGRLLPEHFTAGGVDLIRPLR